ncbi:hypothetical protein BGZ50_003032 [Haplosporangium sp. Z 11]|nr:hypothetical protein BGZ50_003032 [Haplosporangium sp. Z 11]
MSRPKYLGNSKFIPSTVDTKSYFLETAVADWDLADFLLSGQKKDVFLKGLEGLFNFKAVSRDIRAFARALAMFYSVEQNIVIATNHAEELLNRRALKGFEHRVVQNELQASLINDLRRKQTGDEDGLKPVTNSTPTSDVLVDGEPEKTPVSTGRSRRFEGSRGQPTMGDQDHENEGDLPAELAMVASCTPFAHLVMMLYEKHGHTPARIDGLVPFPTHTTKDLYNFAKNIVDNWHTCSKIEQKNCLVALSGIVNTLDPGIQLHCAAFSDVVDQCLDKDFFTVSGVQEAIYKDLTRKLGHGTMKELRALRRYCSRRRDDLEEDYDNDGWPAGKEDACEEELKIMQIMSFLCDEIISMQRISKTSEHEDVFVWRGLARILFEHDLVVRVGELGSSATREDRTLVENKFGGIDTNVRGRKIDIMHQLCLQGRSKPIEIIAWEAKSEAASGEVLQIQLRKNIRINASIMNKLSQYMERDFPRPSPMVLDIVGSRALVYVVRKIEPGIFGVGAVGEKMVELPKNTNEIAEFLDGGSMSALLRIGRHNSEFACLLKKGYRKALSQEIMEKMTGKASVRKEGPPVIFTPKKKQRQRHKQQQMNE